MKRYKKNPDSYRTGHFVIEHVPTGQVYVDVAVNMAKELDRIFEDLAKGVFKNSRLNRLGKMEYDFKVFVYPAPTTKVARDEIKKYRAAFPNHLIVN